jgi:HK97 gp10 family phage protein
MSDEIKFSLTGIDSLLSKFNAISYDLKRKGGRAALRKAAKLVMDQAKENALKIDNKETAQSIASNVGMRWDGKLFKRTGDLGFRVGILKGAVLRSKVGITNTAAGSPTPHWRLLEFGTEKMRAQPFLRRALSENVSQATDTFLTEYEKAIDRALKKAKK